MTDVDNIARRNQLSTITWLLFSAIFILIVSGCGKQNAAQKTERSSNTHAQKSQPATDPTTRTSVLVLNEKVFVVHANIPKSRIDAITGHAMPAPATTLLTAPAILAAIAPDLNDTGQIYALVTTDPESALAKSLHEELSAAGTPVKQTLSMSQGLLKAARHNGIGTKQSALLLDLSWSTTTCTLIHGEETHTRTFPITRATTVQRVAKQLNCSPQEALNTLIAKGFVHPGPAYEDSDDPVAHQISLIVREDMLSIAESIDAFMAEITRKRPAKIYLSGTNSTLSFTDHVLATQLKTEVTWVNAFQRYSFSPQIKIDELSAIAHELPAAIGSLR